MNLLSAIIINYNTPAMTERAIALFINQANGFDYEIILIDNNSTKKMSGAFLEKQRIRFIQNTENVGFAKAVNQGLALAAGDYILLLNSDALVEKDTVRDLLAYLENHQSAGIIGPRFIYPNGRNQISSGRFPSFWRELFRLFMLHRLLPFDVYNRDFKTVRPVDRVSGGCMLIKREVINRIGLFDEDYFFGAEDLDFCLRAGKFGWQTIYYPLAELVHFHSFSSGGRRAAQTIKLERDGLDYFFKKNFPKKVISRLIIRELHNLKILVVNLLNYDNNTKKYLAQDATIAITYKCNSRCRMCNIWQIANPSDLPLSYFYNLSPSLKYINLTGGEPFLRPDLPEIVSIIKTVSPKAKIIISSNGLATDLIVKQVKAILEIDRNIGLRISLDGIGAVHDQVRGLNGFYDQVLKTVSALRNLGVKNLGFSFTIMDFNADQIRAVYDLSKKMNLELALTLVQNSEVYYKKNDNNIAKINLAADNLNYIISEELKSFKVKRWFRAYYDYGLWHYLKFKKRLLKSGAGFDSLFIDPAGDIYPSNLIKLPFGNLGKTKLDEIWHSDLAREMRREMADKNISESWIICTVRGEMKRHLFKIAVWIIKNKFFS